MSDEKTQVYTVNAEMTCGGCSGAITRILNKLDLASFDVSLEKKQFTVTTNAAGFEKVMAKVNKWATAAGKKVSVVE